LLYFENCQKSAQNFPIYFDINQTFEQIRQLYARSKIYWHAAGLGEDQNLCPDRMEHFGISVVEAMSAGCVPVAIRRGGISEIIIHQTSGFLYDTIDEMENYTLSLINDDRLLQNLAHESIQRSKLFDMQRFASEVREIFDKQRQP